ncbi:MULTISPECIES: ECF transporter S component [unclassified Gemella]|uniref:ECF transporter S component n=1 Tax=unclassified Gemella TaxID=2624949 RepID=UPI001C04DCBC|nr:MULTISPECIES: ECF transporter S component [unclassified Gemella]MBU0278160.1 ECF transporter S component [Gemella sp. zg-1178]QWQ38884.1 ECF transporter S component [Gemella sp. zg-570]
MYKKNTHTLILTALLAVVSLILSLVKMAVPFLPPFLTLDLSFIPIFVGLSILGYKQTLVISLLKNFLHFSLISHEPTGSIANIIVEFVFLTCLVYFYKKGNVQTIIGGIVGTVAITLVMSLMNYFILLPLYGYIINLSDIVTNVKTIVAYGIIPFNIIKGLFLIILFFITKSITSKLPSSLVGKFKN